MCNFNGILLSFASNNIVALMLVQDDVRVGGKLKMAAWNRKKISNNVYLTLFTL